MTAQAYILGLIRAEISAAPNIGDGDPCTAQPSPAARRRIRAYHRALSTLRPGASFREGVEMLGTMDPAQ